MRARAEVILHVAGPAVVDAHRAFGGDEVFVGREVELGEDGGVGLAEDVRQDVEPPAMRHAEQDFLRAGLGGVADQLVEHRHEHVRPLDREALLAGEGGVQEMLEALDCAQPLEQVALLVGVQRLPVRAGLDGLVQPVALLVVLHVVEVVADLPQ